MNGAHRRTAPRRTSRSRRTGSPPSRHTSPAPAWRRLQAHAYADLIKDHVAQAAGGRTYAENTEELHATDGVDEKLTELRQTAFMGETLRASLLSAYQAWRLTTLVTGLGGLLAGLGAALVTPADSLDENLLRRP